MNKFLIVGTQRTGSSALAEAIGCHPSILCGWEWTQRVAWRNKLKIADHALKGDFTELGSNDRNHMMKIYHGEAEWLGFRRLFRSSNKWIIHPRFAPALWIDRLEDHLRWLGTQKDIHIIHVMRTDHLAWLRSKFIARQAKIYVGQTYPKNLKITIPLKDATARLRSKQWLDYRLTTLEATNPYLKVYYEDFLKEEEAVVNSTLQFLHCDSQISFNIKHKVNRQSIIEVSEQVLNYKELVVELERFGLLQDG